MYLNAAKQRLKQDRCPGCEVANLLFVPCAMSTAPSSPDGGPGSAAVGDAGDAEKQLSRCEEMVQYSLKRCE